METNKVMDLFAIDRKNRPNKFTVYMGEQIRAAREEAGLSQEKLAKKLYLRRPTLSDIENGKVEVDSSTLELLSYYLKKPLTYFFLNPIYEELVKKDMDELSLEMQMHFELIYGDDLKRLAIKFVKIIEKFDPTNLVKQLAPKVISEIESEEELKKLLVEFSLRSKDEDTD
jgi:transcriptional regulator with XRE-family HTH domain